MRNPLVLLFAWFRVSFTLLATRWRHSTQNQPPGIHTALMGDVMSYFNHKGAQPYIKWRPGHLPPRRRMKNKRVDRWEIVQALGFRVRERCYSSLCYVPVISPSSWSVHSFTRHTAHKWSLLPPEEYTPSLGLLPSSHKALDWCCGDMG